MGWLRLYLAKLGETMVHSSWMVALLALPIFTAYGIVYSGGPLFPFVALAAFVPFLVLPAVVGHGLHLVLVNVFPARRTRELLGLIGLGALVIAVILLRFMQPGAAGPARGLPQLRGLPGRAAHADQPAAAERVDGGDGHELAAAGGGPVADRAAVGAGARWR